MKGNIIPLPDNSPKEKEVYQHYKGDLYRVHELALHSDDEVWMVIYEAVYENPDAHLFALPLSKWRDDVEWEGKTARRFKKVN